MLSANPNLTQQQVFNIITSTSDKVGGYVYTNGRSNELGYGRVNACRTVLEAYRTNNSINGSTLVCTGTSQFQLQNAPASGITWQATPSNLFAVSSGTGSSATLTAANSSVNGQGTLTFTISNSCGPQVQVSKSLIVGVGISDPLFEQKTIVCPSNHYTILARVTQAPEPATYKWYIGSSSGTNFVLKSTTTSNSTMVPGGIPDNLYHVLKVEITNSCNFPPVSTANPEGRFKASCSGGGGGTFAIYPNPASSELNVEFTPEQTASSSGLGAEDSSNEFSVKLINSSSQTVKSGKSKGKKININTHNLQPGMYYLHINKGGEIITEQIQIRK